MLTAGPRASYASHFAGALCPDERPSGRRRKRRRPRDPPKRRINGVGALALCLPRLACRLPTPRLRGRASGAASLQPAPRARRAAHASYGRSGRHEGRACASPQRRAMPPTSQARGRVHDAADQPQWKGTSTAELVPMGDAARRLLVGSLSICAPSSLCRVFHVNSVADKPILGLWQGGSTSNTCWLQVSCLRLVFFSFF